MPAHGAVEASASASDSPAADPTARGAGEGRERATLDSTGARSVDVSAQPSRLGARVIETATLSLATRKGQLDEVVDEARSIAASLGGFVTSSAASQGGAERLVRGTLVLPVPQRAYARAMSALSALGTVRGRRETGEDVSLRYVDLEARARHLEAVERQLLSFLEKTTTVADALVVQERLNEVQLQLEQVRGELRYLDSETTYASISLEIAERAAPVAAPAPRNGWGLRGTWSTAVAGIETVVGAIAIGLVTASPILAIVGIALAFRRLRTRRRSACGEPARTMAG